MVASRLASAVVGSRPGRIGGRVNQPGSLAMVGSSPAWTKEDLPHPDGPTSNSSDRSTSYAGMRSSRARASMSRWRPKKTSGSALEKARNPGKGDR